VTPSFNQGQFIEETIRSVLLQGYPDLEYIIIDGASTDNSVDIIKKYEPWLTYWVSEKDNGQADAINKGWKRATGEVLTWLNSDDIYLIGTLRAVAAKMDPSQSIFVVFGDAYLTDETNNIVDIWRGRFSRRRDLIRFWNFWHSTRGTCWIMQPATFVHRQVLEHVGLLDESIYHGMDYDLWLRVTRHFHFCHIDQVLATYRLHPASKTVADTRQHEEAVAISKRYWGKPWTPRFWFYHTSYQIFVLKKSSQNLYRAAEECWRAGQSLRSQVYLFLSILVFPPNCTQLSHITLILRNLFGNTVYERLKARLRVFRHRLQQG
jgi:glycosyltransferase involved in cell wall biosynthesis